MVPAAYAGWPSERLTIASPNPGATMRDRRDFLTGAIISNASLFEREDALPVVLHADHDPTLLLRLVVERRGEGADLGVGQPARRTVGVLALRIVVEHEHREPYAVAGSRVLEHLPIADRVAERRIGPAPR